MAVYDENILKNPFYLELEKQRPDLFSRVAEVHGVVLVPCRESLSAGSYKAAQFESYVLLPTEQGFQTTDGKEVLIESNQVNLKTGFLSPASIPILFEETFYNEKEQAYSILCITRPIEAEPNSVGLSLFREAYYLKNVKEVKEFLGGHAEKLDKFIVAFCHSFKETERKSLRHHIDAVHTLYTKCLQCLLRDSRLKVLTKQELQMTLLKQAVEMFIHSAIHEFLFRYVGSLEASRDADFNKNSRRLQDLQQKDLGVKLNFSINISRAKRELSELNRCTSPQEKLLCLRKVAFTIMQSPSSRVNLEAVCADDLLSVILYLIVKTEIPNWMANLSYIKNFHLCNSTKDDLSYCLTSFEAAVEYISQGNLNEGPMGPGEVNDKPFFRHKVNLQSQATSPIDCLFEHIANGNETEVKRLLSEGESEDDRKKLCHPLCSCDACDLFISGKLNDPSIVTPCSRDDRGYTPLHVAAMWGQSLLIDLLVLKGATVNATDYHSFTALHLSCQKGYQGVTLLLLHYKANADAQDNNGNTPLHLACMYGHEDCVKALVYYDLHKCQLNVQNDKGDTALHIAARWGYEGIMEVLLENGASTLINNKANQTPLHCALNSRVLSLLEQACNGSTRKESGFEALNQPPLSPDRNSRRSSVSSNCSFHFVDACSEMERAHQKEVEKLLRAVADGDVEMVRYLLEWLDEDPEDGRTNKKPDKTELCHPLCQCPNCAPVQKKLTSVQSEGLWVNSSSSADGFTPLHIAAMHGRSTLVSLLICHGANINSCNRLCATPLHVASQNGHVQVVKTLVECNAKLNNRNNLGNSPLIQACQKGHGETVTALIEAGALVNLANNQGNTALHEAVKGGYQTLVEILLQAGAHPHLRNKRQRTAVDCAEEAAGKNTAILKILQKAYVSTLDVDSAKQICTSQTAPSLIQQLNQNCSDWPRLQLKNKSHPQDRNIVSTDSPDMVSGGQCCRRQLQRGETFDSSSSIINLPKSSDFLLHQAKTLNRSHTIHEDLTHSSSDVAETSETATSKPSELNISPDLSPDPELTTKKTEERMPEDEKLQCINLHSISTEMENIGL